MSVKLGARSDVTIDNKLSSLNPVALVLHNDDINSMDHVVQTLVSNIPEITVEEALEKNAQGTQLWNRNSCEMSSRTSRTLSATPNNK